MDTDHSDYDVRLVLKDAMHFHAATRSAPGHTIYLDSDAEFGGLDRGSRPLDLMLVSLASCTAMDVISILRKKQQVVSGMEVLVRAERATEYPKVFTHIWLTFVVTGRNVEPEAVRRSIELSMTRYCPAAAMLQQVVPIETDYRVIEAVQ
jgi:putative redox protein